MCPLACSAWSARKTGGVRTPPAAIGSSGCKRTGSTRANWNCERWRVPNGTWWRGGRGASEEASPQRPRDGVLAVGVALLGAVLVVTGVLASGGQAAADGT